MNVSQQKHNPAKQVCVKPPSSVGSQHAIRICCSASAPATRHHSYRGTSYQQGAQQQTRRPPLLLLIGGTDGRRTDADRYIDPSPHTMRVASIKQEKVERYLYRLFRPATQLKTHRNLQFLACSCQGAITYSSSCAKFDPNY